MYSCILQTRQQPLFVLQFALFWMTSRLPIALCALWGLIPTNRSFTLPITLRPLHISDLLFLCPNFVPKPARRTCTQANKSTASWRMDSNAQIETQIGIAASLSLPALMFHCFFDCFVLLHKSPICRFYPYLSMLFQWIRNSISCSVVSSFVLLTLRPLNQTTKDAGRQRSKTRSSTLTF